MGGIPRGTLWELWSGRGRRGDDHPAYRMRGASRPRGGMHVGRCTSRQRHHAPPGRPAAPAHASWACRHAVPHEGLRVEACSAAPTATGKELSCSLLGTGGLAWQQCVSASGQRGVVAWPSEQAVLLCRLIRSQGGGRRGMPPTG